MATKEQYEFFRRLYDEEDQTSVQLEGRAKVYLSIITAFLVALLLKAEEVAKSAHTLGVPWWAMLVEGLIFGLSLLCVVLALRIRAFEAVADPEAVIGAYEGDGPTDDEFYEDRIADYAVASTRNRAANNQTATVLAWAGWLLVIGMMFMLVIIALAFRNAP